VLLAIMAGTSFAHVLQQVANGSFPASVMFQVLGLNMLDGLTTLLPLSAFLGVLNGLGRMYRESEMPVLASSGGHPFDRCGDPGGHGVAVAGAVGGAHL